MKTLEVTTLGAAYVLALAGTSLGCRSPAETFRMQSYPASVAQAASYVPVHSTPHAGATPLARAKSLSLSSAELDSVVQRFCGASCHSERSKSGNLVLAGFAVDDAPEADNVAVAEKMIRKLRADMMPPPNARRPGGDTLIALAASLEKIIDEAARRPNPGARTFQRLNRPEYAAAIKDLLDLDVDAGAWLPLDTKSANFDNIADVQALSPTLLEAYLNAAAAISKMAIGDTEAALTQTAYSASPFASQYPWNHVEGAPYGTRGGIVAKHNFPADGMYSFRLNVQAGVGTRLEDIDISINGERIKLLQYERGIERSIVSADAPLGADYVRSEPLLIKAGQHTLSAAFVRRSEGPYEDLIKPHDWSRAGNGTASSGTTAPPHLLEMVVYGPHEVKGLSETASRARVFSCRPADAAKARACAEQIVTGLASRAYRRPAEKRDVEGLLVFYDEAARAGGFEAGVRASLQAILASPHFVFRMEAAPSNARPGQDYRLADVDLASRLSFFLWGSLPDEELMQVAEQRKLSDEKVLEAQVRRMLADPRSEALGSRFAAQWLRLQDLDKVQPDAFWFPDYDQQLADAMRTETQLFFNYIVREDRSVLDFFTADYTFVNERLAQHYGIPKVSGEQFQMVTYPDETRRGLLGHGSILVQTSLGNRTSPVLRGKWVMEVLLGNPPPPPPPGVPDLEETSEAKDGRFLTTRERMELHRRNAVCRSCHQYMDPMGLALDNFDVTGKWRYRENGMPLDTRGQMYDGTEVERPADLVNALVKRPIPLVRAFTENLMAYALGRRVEVFDQPTVRDIAEAAESQNYRMSSFIIGVVKSNAFQYKRAVDVAESQSNGQH